MRVILLSPAAIALMGAGCSSSTDASAPTQAPSSASGSAVAEDVENSGGDFCSLYAARVAQGLVGIRTATEGGAQVAEGIATDLANQAAVSQSDLEAAAPPEPLGYLDAIAA